MILNKTMSLVVVATTLPVRLLTIPLSDMAEHWDVAAGVAAGVGIGVVASVMGVAGGELLIPALTAILLISAIKVWRHR